MAATALLLLTVSVPHAVKKHGPDLFKEYLILSGLLFNLTIIFLLIWYA